MDKKEALAQIGELVKQAYATLAQAEKIAEEAGVTFSFLPAYGMGGTYLPETAGRSPWCYNEEFGWQPSSQSC